METLFKKQFWVVTLAFLAANAFLLARASNQFVAYAILTKLQPAAEADAAAARAPKAPPRGKAAKTLRDTSEDHNIFGARVEDLSAPNPAALAAEAAAQKAAETAAANQEPVPTALRIKLTGVTWSTVPEFSIASILDLGSNATELYSVNNCPPPPPPPGPPDEDGTPPPPPPIERVACNKLQGDTATITQIDPDRVVFFNKSTSRKEFAAMFEDPKDPKAPPVPASVAAAPAAPDNKDADDNLGKNIVKVAENQYKVPQSDVDEVMANLNNVASQARIVPSFENGKPNGFKLFSIRPNSIFGRLGMQNGDVISKINGYDMSSPDKALEVYSKLKDSKEITVEMTRRGQKVTSSYTIQ